MTHFHPVPQIQMLIATPLLSLYAFMACKRTLLLAAYHLTLCNLRFLQNTVFPILQGSHDGE
jgi:hypothetical protein